MLPLFGVPVEREGLTVGVKGGVGLRSCDLDIPGDPSSAAFFAAAALIVPHGEVLLHNITLNPPRAAFYDVQYDLKARRCPASMGPRFDQRGN